MAASYFPPAFVLAAEDWRDLLLTRLSFSELPGFRQDDHLEAFEVFTSSCAAIEGAVPPLRPGIPPSPGLKAIAHEALNRRIGNSADARQFFEAHFRPFHVSAKGAGPQGSGFLTGYYEPIVDGSLEPAPDFAAAILARPDNLEMCVPYPDRAAIEAGAIDGHTAPLVWLRDPIEVFLVQVQGSARVRLKDGRLVKLVYAGRNGHPYTSIGRVLIESGEMPETEMSLSGLKSWARAHGQNTGQAGLELMQRNRSYVFFALQEEAHSRGARPAARGSI